MTIKIENTEVFGWEAAIRGLRNPMNSWDRSDSNTCENRLTENGNCKGCPKEGSDTLYCCVDNYILGENDHKLMMNLAKAGSEHAKYLRMINVTMDVTAPLYWWKEFDTYKIGTIANSCSTVHKIHEKKFTLDDFSHEHVTNVKVLTVENEPFSTTIPHQVLCATIDCLNGARERYVETKDKLYWWQMIQLLPSSYNQKRTIQLNYQVLSAIYHQRKNHKFDEWIEFCDWIKSLPYSELITLEEK